MERERERSYLCVTKIEVNGFGVSNVKDAIGLWREAGANLKGISQRRGLSCDKYCHTQEFFFPNLWHQWRLYLATSLLQVLFQQLHCFWRDHVAFRFVVLTWKH